MNAKEKKALDSAIAKIEKVKGNTLAEKEAKVKFTPTEAAIYWQTKAQRIEEENKALQDKANAKKADTLSAFERSLAIEKPMIPRESIGDNRGDASKKKPIVFHGDSVWLYTFDYDRPAIVGDIVKTKVNRKRGIETTTDEYKRNVFTAEIRTDDNGTEAIVPLPWKGSKWCAESEASPKADAANQTEAFGHDAERYSGYIALLALQTGIDLDAAIEVTCNNLRKVFDEARQINIANLDSVFVSARMGR